jgi:hypothetical protein
MAKKEGRPTVMTKETIDKLEEIFALGGTDKEACFYANISHQTLYDYQNIHPEFIERKEALKETPVLKARRAVVAKVGESYTSAMDYLSRKKKDEFSLRQELTGKEGEPLFKPSEEEQRKVEEAIDKYLKINGI